MGEGYLRLDRAWTFKKWTLSAFIDVVNATYSQTILSVGYPKDPALGLIRYDKPQFNGFKWILPSVGLRGSF